MRQGEQSKQIGITGTCSCEFVFKCRGKHVWEELEGDRKQELHEGDYDKDGKRNKS